MFLTNFPLPNSGQAGVQYRRQNRLTDLVACSQRADLFRIIDWNLIQAERIDFAHFALINKAQTVQIACRSMNGLKNCTLGFNFLGDWLRDVLDPRMGVPM